MPSSALSSSSFFFFGKNYLLQHLVNLTNFSEYQVLSPAPPGFSQQFLSGNGTRTDYGKQQHLSRTDKPRSPLQTNYKQIGVILISFLRLVQYSVKNTTENAGTAISTRFKPTSPAKPLHRMTATPQSTNQKAGMMFYIVLNL